MEMEHGNLLDEMGTDSTMMVAIGGEGWWGRYCKVQIVSIESSLRQSKKKRRRLSLNYFHPFRSTRSTPAKARSIKGAERTRFTISVANYI